MGEERDDEPSPSPTGNRAGRPAVRPASGRPEPHRSSQDHTVAAVCDSYRDLTSGAETSDVVRLAGRITQVRRQGGLTFLTLADRTGQIQLYVDRETFGEQPYQALRELARDDWLRVRGTVMRTRRGELSVRVATMAILGLAARARCPDAAHSGVRSLAETASGPTNHPHHPHHPGPSAVRRPGTPRSARLVDPQPAEPADLPRPTGPPSDAAETLVPSLAANAEEGEPVLPAAAAPRADWAVARAERRTARTVATGAGLGGIFLVLALIPSVHAQFGAVTAEALPLWLRTAGHVVMVLVGLLLVLIAGQLAKQKRRAWQLSVVLFSVGAVSGIVKGPQVLPVLYCMIMVAVLAATRRVFRAVPDPPSLLNALRVVPLYIAAVLTYGLTSLYFERRQIQPELSVRGALETIGLGMVGLPGHYTYRSEFFADFFPAALLVLGVFGLVSSVYLLLRPLRAFEPHTDQGWNHAQRLIRDYGWDTLNYFALRDDKSLFFGSDGEAMVAYTYLGGYALVSGDPIGAPASVPRVLDEFAEFCRVRAWELAFLAVREADTPLYAARGFRRFYLGDEAIIRCDRFSLDGHAKKGLRAAVRRVGRNHRFRLLPESVADPELVSQLNAISATWRGKRPERGFAMTLRQEVLGAGANPDFLLCVALDQHGAPAGFLRIVPVYGAQPGYTLDLMRHDPRAPNGMTEYLVAQTALALGERGFARFSLNFAPFGRLYEPGVPLTTRQRLARRLVALMSPFIQVRSLREFNARFAPDWLPRMLVYRDHSDLPKVGLRYSGAEGFLALPLVGSLFVPKLVGGAPAPSRAPATPPSARRRIGRPGGTGSPDRPRRPREGRLGPGRSGLRPRSVGRTGRPRRRCRSRRR